MDKQVPLVDINSREAGSQDVGCRDAAFESQIASDRTRHDGFDDRRRNAPQRSGLFGSALQKGVRDVLAFPDAFLIGMAGGHPSTPAIEDFAHE